MIPPAHSGALGAQMEDVLAVYQMPYDPQVPLVYMDAHPVQSIKETKPPLPAAPGQPEQVAYEYERHGTANICLLTEPLCGTRHVRGTEHRPAVDWAQEIRELLEVRYPKASRVRLGCDNLNTRGMSSLYDAFPPEQARRLAARLELHHTPKHGSGLHSAEIALSARTLQCLDRRRPDLETLRQETTQWEQRRSATQKGVDGQCSTQDSRIKLNHLYPQIEY